jgi:hypothetical protein
VNPERIGQISPSSCIFVSDRRLTEKLSARLGLQFDSVDDQVQRPPLDPRRVKRWIDVFRSDIADWLGVTVAVLFIVAVFAGVFWLLWQAVRSEYDGDRAQLKARCELSLAEDCHDYAVLLLEADSEHAADPVKARKVFRKSCRFGHAPACAQYARMLAEGKGGPADVAGGFKSLLDECERFQTVEVCLERVKYLFRLEKGDLAAVYEDQRRTCAVDNYEACTRAAVLILAARKLTRDPAKADKLFRRACRGGIGLACDFAQKPKPKKLAKPNPQLESWVETFLKVECVGIPDADHRSQDDQACLAYGVYLVVRPTGPNPRKAAVEQLKRPCHLEMAGACAWLERARLLPERSR